MADLTGGIKADAANTLLKQLASVWQVYMHSEITDLGILGDYPDIMSFSCGLWRDLVSRPFQKRTSVET